MAAAPTDPPYAASLPRGIRYKRRAPEPATAAANTADDAATDRHEQPGAVRAAPGIHVDIDRQAIPAAALAPDAQQALLLLGVSAYNQMDLERGVMDQFDRAAEASERATLLQQVRRAEADTIVLRRSIASITEQIALRMHRAGTASGNDARLAALRAERRERVRAPTLCRTCGRRGR